MQTPVNHNRSVCPATAGGAGAGAGETAPEGEGAGAGEEEAAGLRWGGWNDDQKVRLG